LQAFLTLLYTWSRVLLSLDEEEEAVASTGKNGQTAGYACLIFSF